MCDCDCGICDIYITFITMTYNIISLLSLVQKKKYKIKKRNYKRLKNRKQSSLLKRFLTALMGIVNEYV